MSVLLFLSCLPFLCCWRIRRPKISTTFFHAAAMPFSIIVNRSSRISILTVPSLSLKQIHITRKHHENRQQKRALTSINGHKSQQHNNQSLNTIGSLPWSLSSGCRSQNSSCRCCSFLHISAIATEARLFISTGERAAPHVRSPTL